MFGFNSTTYVVEYKKATPQQWNGTKPRDNRLHRAFGMYAASCEINAIGSAIDLICDTLHNGNSERDYDLMQVKLYDSFGQLEYVYYDFKATPEDLWVEPEQPPMTFSWEPETDNDAPEEEESIEELSKKLVNGIAEVITNAFAEALQNTGFGDFKKATPSEELYPHYKSLSNTPGVSLPGVKVVTNASGTEYEFMPISRLLEGEDINPEYGEVFERIIATDKGKYAMVDKAKDMSRIFHVNKSVFDPKHDRENEINQGLLHRAYMMSALRSFAWTLAEYCEDKKTAPKDVEINTLKNIVRFISYRKWLNYDDNGRCNALCSGSDLHVYFFPDKASQEDKDKFVTTEEEKERDRKIKEKFPNYRVIHSEVRSLEGLRKDLEYIYPAVQKLWDTLLEERNYNEALLGDEADIVYAWCSLAYAAKEPFYCEDGPMRCFFEQMDTNPPKKKGKKAAEKKSEPIAADITPSSFRFYEGTRFLHSSGLFIPVPDGYHYQLNGTGDNQLWSYIVPKDVPLSENHIDAKPYSFGITDVSISTTSTPFEAEYAEPLKGELVSRGYMDGSVLVRHFIVSDHCAFIYQRWSDTCDKYYNKINGILFAKNNSYQFHFYVNHSQPVGHDEETLVAFNEAVETWMRQFILIGDTENVSDKKTPQTPRVAVPEKKPRAKSTKKAMHSYLNGYLFPEYEVKNTRKKFLLKSPGLRLPVQPDGCDVQLVSLYSGDKPAEKIELAKAIEGVYLTEEKRSARQKLIDKALEISQLFATADNESDAGNDKAAMIKGGYLKTIYQLHCLRSFAWTLTKWAKENKKEIKDVTVDDLLALSEYIENSLGANYNASTVSDTAFCATLRPKQEFNKVYAGISGCVLYERSEDAESGPTSIYALRNDLLTLLPAIDTIFDYCSNEYEAGESTDSTLSDILFAWAAFAFASREAFTVAQGPESITLTNNTPYSEETFAEVNPDENGFYIHNGALLAVDKKKCTSDNVTIPDGVKEIVFNNGKLSCLVYEEHPDFYFLQDVTSITIPGTMKISGSFPHQKALKNVTFLEGVQTISRGVFGFNNNVERFSLPEGLKEIGPSAFASSKKIKSVVIPSSVEVISDDAFSSCEQLEQVHIMSSAKIGKAAFRMCRSLKNVYFEGAVTEIGEEAFSFCGNLEKVVFSPTLKKIGAKAFDFSNNIKRMTIPASVTEIGDNAFNAVHGLEGPDSFHFKGNNKFDFVFEVYKDSYAEQYAKSKGWYHTVILTEEQKAEKLRKEAEENARKEALRLAEEKRIAEQKRAEEEARKREEALKLARYQELKGIEAELLKTIEENKGIFGEKAKKRKTAKEKLDEIRAEIEKIDVEG